MAIDKSDVFPSPAINKTGWPWAREISDKPALQSYPLISIVTPSFNQGQFIEQTICSVLLQEYPNIEYIIIDGGSTDNSVEIIKKYESYLSYWASEPDKGQSHAINKGFKKCTGQIMGWLNSDDYLKDGTLHLLAEELSDSSGSFALVGHCLKVFPDNTPSKVLYGNYENPQRLLEFWKGYGMHQSSIFWRREVFEKVGFLNEDEHYVMDFDYWVRIALHFSFKNIDKVLSCATYHTDAKTGDNYQTYNKHLRFKSKQYWKSVPGIDIDTMQKSLDDYDNFRLQVIEASKDIAHATLLNSQLILVDEELSEIDEMIEGRHFFPFLELNGTYNGAPEDDATAIKELERLRKKGADFLVFIWFTFWWLDYYKGFVKYLNSHYKKVLDNEKLVIYQLN